MKNNLFRITIIIPVKNYNNNIVFNNNYKINLYKKINCKKMNKTNNNFKINCKFIKKIIYKKKIMKILIYKNLN